MSIEQKPTLKKTVEQKETPIRIEELVSRLGEYYRDLFFGHWKEEIPKDRQVLWMDFRPDAEAAVAEVEKAIENHVPLDDTFIESVSAGIHNKWIEKTGDGWVAPELKKPYEALSEQQKEVIKRIVRFAIDICENF